MRLTGVHEACCGRSAKLQNLRPPRTMDTVAASRAAALICGLFVRFFIWLRLFFSSSLSLRYSGFEPCVSISIFIRMIGRLTSYCALHGGS
jgi:hypothetical protein